MAFIKLYTVILLPRYYCQAYHCTVRYSYIGLPKRTELNRRVSSELRHKYVLMSIILMYISHLVKNKEKMDIVS